MNEKKILIFVVLILEILLINVSCSNAKDLTASMAKLPVLIEDKDTGAFVELVKAIGEVYTEGNIIREVYPFKRSLNNVIQGKADFHIPLIRNPLIPESSLPFRYSSLPTGPVAFVIYSRKDNPITKQDIEKAAKKSKSDFAYKIDTLQGQKKVYELTELITAAIMMFVFTLNHRMFESHLQNKNKGVQ
ncbi:MAG: hypothetical protein BWK80_14735 [Desulfobacteraceae bacterium IS3]|nr:MAG: hypothetical protein BWK80_14735 [Desulfobacteraceae bacterium IS3]HAO22932.1 hypothetical protein [Desulfobacteraceae bacterium]